MQKDEKHSIRFDRSSVCMSDDVFSHVKYLEIDARSSKNELFILLLEQLPAIYSSVWGIDNGKGALGYICRGAQGEVEFFYEEETEVAITSIHEVNCRHFYPNYFNDNEDDLLINVKNVYKKMFPYNILINRGDLLICDYEFGKRADTDYIIKTVRNIDEKTLYIEYTNGFRFNFLNFEITHSTDNELNIVCDKLIIINRRISDNNNKDYIWYSEYYSNDSDDIFVETGIREDLSKKVVKPLYRVGKIVFTMKS